MNDEAGHEGGHRAQEQAERLGRTWWLQRTEAATYDRMVMERLRQCQPVPEHMKYLQEKGMALVVTVYGGAGGRTLSVLVGTS